MVSKEILTTTYVSRIIMRNEFSSNILYAVFCLSDKQSLISGMHDSATGQINAIRLTFNSCQKHEIETKGISFLLSKNDPI